MRRADLTTANVRVSCLHNALCSRNHAQRDCSFVIKFALQQLLLHQSQNGRDAGSPSGSPRHRSQCRRHHRAATSVAARSDLAGCARIKLGWPPARRRSSQSQPPGRLRQALHRPLLLPAAPSPPRPGSAKPSCCTGRARLATVSVHPQPLVPIAARDARKAPHNA